MNQKKAYFYIALGLPAFATAPTVSKLFFAGVSPYEILAWSCIPAALLFLVVTAWNGKLKMVKTLPVKTLIAMAAIGLVGVLVYNAFFQMGVARLPAQQAFVIQYLWPAMIIIWARILSHEEISVGKWCAILLSFAGVVIVAIDGDPGQIAGGNLLGILACLAAAVSYGFYSAMNKKVRYDTELMLLLGFFVSIFFGFGLALMTGGVHVPTPHLAVGYLFYGLITTGIAYLLWLKALKAGSTAVISNLAYLTPVISLFMTHFILGEAITIWSAGGLALILLGIAIQIWLSKR